MTEAVVDLNSRDASGHVRGRCYGLCSVGDRIRVVDNVAEVKGWAKVAQRDDFGKVRLDVEWHSFEPT